MKKLSLGALAALVGSALVAGVVPQSPVSAATAATATKLVSGTGATNPSAAVGDAGLGEAWGVGTTKVGTTRWTVFESSANNLVANDTNAASDVFVTDGTTVTRLSVSASGGQGSVGLNSFDPVICGSGRKVAFTTENEWDQTDSNGAQDVYVIDRDADADGVMDEFSQPGGVIVQVASVSYNTGIGEFDIAFTGAGAPSISDDCSKVAFSTEQDFTLDDLNFSPDVYLRDVTSAAAAVTGVTGSGTAVTYTASNMFEVGDLVTISGVSPTAYNLVNVPVTARTATSFTVANPTTTAFVSGGVAVKTPKTTATWVSTYASGGSAGGGYLPTLNSDGSKVVFTTESTDVVSSAGTVGGLVMSTIGVASVSAQYLTRTPAGAASTATLADNERTAAVTPNGRCVAFKADRGYDLVASNGGAAQGIYLWDNRGASPVITLISKDSTGVAASSASNPRISDDCRFVAYQSNDEFLSTIDNNRKTDVFLYDTITRETSIMSKNAAGTASSDGVSAVAALDWDPTSGTGVVQVLSNASNLGGAAGGGSVINLFSVPFTADLISADSFTSLSAPARLLDTRSGSKVGAKDGNGAPYVLTVAGQQGVPASGVSAVALNVTVVDGEDPSVGGGYVTVYPCGTRPNSSNLNFVGGQTVPNAVIAPLSAQGKVCFYVYGKAHLLADVSGFFATGFTSLSAPARFLDTRSGSKIGAADGNGTPYTLTVAGANGVPGSGVGAVAMNVTVVDGEDPSVGGGYVTVYPCGTRPNASNLNFVGGQTVPNAVIAPLSAQGKVCFYVYGKAHLLADVSGYFNSGFTSLSAPARFLDSRSGSKIGAADGNGAAYTLTVAGANGVPAGVSAVAMNVTVVDGGDPSVGGGYVTVYPCGTRPNASNLNFVGGQTVPNAVIAPVSAQGTVCFYVYGTAHLLADVSGYFAATA